MCSEPLPLIIVPVEPLPHDMAVGVGGTSWWYHSGARSRVRVFVLSDLVWERKEGREGEGGGKGRESRSSKRSSKKMALLHPSKYDA